MSMDENEFYETPKPTWEKPCERCGTRIARYRGGGDVICRMSLASGGTCDARYNAGGERLSDAAPVFSGDMWDDDPYDDEDAYRWYDG